MATLSDQALPTAMQKPKRTTAFKAALLAYQTVFHRRWAALRSLLVPMFAGGLVLYVSLSAYLSELLLFLETKNPQAASLALGSLAAGLFLWLFCCAIAVGALSRLAFGRESPEWLPFRPSLQEWRLYAAYLRFLLLMAIVVLFTYFLGAFVVPLFRVPSFLASSVLCSAGGAAIFWLIVRIGFLIAPVVACSKGPVLRRAWKESTYDFRRNAVLVMLLLAPVIAIQAAGEVLLRLVLAPPMVTDSMVLLSQAQSMEKGLAAFLAVVSLSSVVSLTLLTFGGMAAYQPNRLRSALAGAL